MQDQADPAEAVRRCSPNSLTIRRTSCSPSCLSMGVLLGWQFFYAGPKLKEEQERQKRLQGQPTTTQQQPAGAPAAPRLRRPRPRAARPRSWPRRGARRPGSVAVAAAQSAAMTRDAALKLAPRLRDRHARAQRLDRPEGRPPRRSRAGQISRDRRSQERRTWRCCRRPRRPSPTSPSTAGWRPPAPRSACRTRTRCGAPRAGSVRRARPAR